MNRPSGMRRWWRFLQLTWLRPSPQPFRHGRFAPRPGSTLTTD